MTTFAQAISNQTLTYTENGMPALTTTTDSALDFFYTIGASRGKNIIPLFVQALEQDENLAIRTALWARDVRGGAGERQLFRDILLYLDANRPDLIARILSKVPEMGRWDDLLVIQSPEAFAVVAKMIKDQIDKEFSEFGQSIASKWMNRKGPNAVRLRKAWGMSPKQYRKFLVNTTNVVENQMCAKEFSEINFEKVPSLAMARYAKAFNRRTPETFSAYMEALKNGTAKINAGAVYPYDVLKTMQQGQEVLANEQWNALPNFLGNDFILPVIDVSGSMGQPAAGSLEAMDVAISLGLYLADKQQGPFSKMSMTFSEKPEFQNYSNCKSLKEMYTLARRANWGMSTNFQAVFEKILNLGIQNKIPQSEMPKYVLVLSDMEFNQADRRFNDTLTGNETAHEMIKKLYQTCGYELPTIVYWNLVSRNQHVPVKADENGTILISGFSPAIMKSVLSVDTESINPRNVFLNTVMNQRYDF
jgi:hypothetical protein